MVTCMKGGKPFKVWADYEGKVRRGGSNQGEARSNNGIWAVGMVIQGQVGGGQ